MIVKNRYNNADFDLDNIKEFYGQAELTNRLLDREDAEEWAEDILCKDGRRGQAFYIFDRGDYPEGAEDMADAAEHLPWHDPDYIVGVYVEE